jgi:hypothetical protein
MKRLLLVLAAALLLAACRFSENPPPKIFNTEAVNKFMQFSYFDGPVGNYVKVYEIRDARGNAYIVVATHDSIAICSAKE